MSSTPQVAPYGTWSSPITSDVLAAGIVSLNEVLVNPVTGVVYAIEGRPAEGGRCCLVKYNESGSIELLSAKYNVRSKVHGYGGGASTISRDGHLVFTDFKTNSVFIIDKEEEEPRCLISGMADTYYADFDVHPKILEWIIAVQVQHHGGNETSTIVAINTLSGSAKVIIQGADFYSSPRFSCDGSRIAWIQWNHPDMPWTGCQLFVADWNSDQPVTGCFVAGKAGTESICQPRWNDHGTLYFLSDLTGYSQLYFLDDKSFQALPIILPGFETVEFGAKETTLGNSSYIFLDYKTIIMAFTKNAVDGILLLDTVSGSLQELKLGFLDIQKNSIRRVSDTSFTVISSTTTRVAELCLVDIKASITKTSIKRTSDLSINEKNFSTAEQITFPQLFGTHKKAIAHAVFLRPHNPAFISSPISKPPLIVYAHAGPNSHSTMGLELRTQYWTSRGYAYVLVNYRGSTGYGRAYRDCLNGFWGENDADDVASCVYFLTANSLVDPLRVGIIGGSAGGYTVLQSLRRHPDIWAGGVSYFGIGNLQKLAEMTHKFEAHYLFGLLFGSSQGTIEERKRVFIERSPVFHSDEIKAPLLILQGRDDEVVSLDQAEDMAAAIREREGARDIKVVIYDGEGHGFRRKETLKSSIEEEERWWAKVLV